MHHESQHRPRTACLLVALLVSLLALPGCEGRAPAQRLALGPCHLDGLAEVVRCGVLPVPADRAQPGGASIEIAVAVLPALRRTAYSEPLFILAGGPGQGARSFARLSETLIDIRRQRDLVLVDLRGTGDSSPLDCPDPLDPLERLARGGAPTDVAACRDRQPHHPRWYTNEHALADLDQVRAALGYQRVALWGGSYGTRAALLYARSYPGRVSAVVLDGAVPPALRFPQSVAADAQRALDLLLDDCAREAECAAAYPDLRRDVRRLLDTLAARPAPVALRHPRTGLPVELVLPRDGAAEILRVMLYLPDHARLLPHLVTRALAGDLAPLVAQHLRGAEWSTDTMALGQTFTVLCSEDLPRVNATEDAAVAAGSFVGSIELDVWRDICAAWPPAPPPPALFDESPVAAPALVLSGERDPVTPPFWGEVMTRAFTPSRHLVVANAGHNVSFDGCMPELIARFLADPRPSAVDAACIGTPQRPAFAAGPAGTAP